MSTPVDTQILSAVRSMLVSAATGAGSSIHVHRTDADPFTANELPAINLLAVEESVHTPSVVGMAVGGALRHHRLQLVVQVITSGSSAAADQARLISAQAELAMGSDPTLSGLCSQAMLLTGKQWLPDDEADARLLRQNNLWVCGYRTNSQDPFTAI